MKIVLVRPPFVDPQAGPPIGLAYIKNVLNCDGHDTFIYDINLDIKKNISNPMHRYNRDFVLPDKHPAIEYAYKNINHYCKTIISFQPDIVGFYLSYPTKDFADELAKRISKDIKCIAGGPHTMHHQNCLLDLGYYSTIVVGDGEESILEALEKDGIIQNPLKKNKEYIPELNDFSIEDYNYTLPVVTTRGCPNQCNFCTANSPFYHHSIESVINQFTKFPNIRRITYNDANINVDARRTEKLFGRLSQFKNKPFGHIFGMQIKKGYERYIPSMADSGIREVRLGVESGSVRERRSMRKVEFSNSLIVDFIKYLTIHKIHAKVQFIFCYPDQTEEDRRKTFHLIQKINEKCDNQYVTHVFNKFVIHHGTENYFKEYYGVFANSPQNWENSLYNTEKIKKIRDELFDTIPANCKIHL